jgi:hypothetical protein
MWRAAQDLSVAEGQLRDYLERLGRPFEHETYLKELAELRDQLKAGLSSKELKEGELTVPEVVEKLKQLRGANSVETTIERTATRKLFAEEPVTSRIRGRAMEEPTTVVEGVEVKSATIAPSLT